MNDKLKFYRETLVEMTKEAYRKKPKELKTEEAVEEAELLTKAIMRKIYEYEFKERPSIKDCVISTSITCTDPNFYKSINPDYLKTESMRTIVDNGPQYQPNQKPYGTLGEHWKELMVLFDFKNGFDNWKELFKSEIIPELLEYKCLKPREHFFRNYYKAVNDVYQKLGIEFIEDFVKACEKCEE